MGRGTLSLARRKGIALLVIVKVVDPTFDRSGMRIVYSEAIQLRTEFCVARLDKLFQRVGQ
jgi:hypothetical protein